MAERSRTGLAAGALEIAHKGDQGFDGGQLDGVIERNAYATNGAMTGGTDKGVLGGFGGKLVFDGLVAAGNAKHDVHDGAVGLGDGATVEATARFDGFVQELGFGGVAALDAGKAAFRFNPFENEADDIDGEGGRGVVERLLLDVRAVL